MAGSQVELREREWTAADSEAARERIKRWPRLSSAAKDTLEVLWEMHDWRPGVFATSYCTVGIERGVCTSTASRSIDVLVKKGLVEVVNQRKGEIELRLVNVLALEAPRGPSTFRVIADRSGQRELPLGTDDDAGEGANVRANLHANLRARTHEEDDSANLRAKTPPVPPHAPEHQHERCCTDRAGAGENKNTSKKDSDSKTLKTPRDSQTLRTLSLETLLERLADPDHAARVDRARRVWNEPGDERGLISNIARDDLPRSIDTLVRSLRFLAFDDLGEEFCRKVAHLVAVGHKQKQLAPRAILAIIDQAHDRIRDQSLETTPGAYLSAAIRGHWRETTKGRPWPTNDDLWDHPP